MEIENINLNNKLVPDKEVLRVERAIQNMLNCDDLIKEQREKLHEYNQYLMGGKKLTRTRRNYLNAVKNLGTFLKKPFEDATKKDLEEYLGKLKVSDNTFWFWQFIIKIFYQWLYNLERKQYPEAVSWIKVEKPSKQKIPLFLVEEQVKKLIEIADCVRDKCILSILMDSGCRVGEIVSLNIGDIKFDEKNPVAYFEVKNVEGCKTGSRNLPIPLVNSVPILRELINTHPLRNQKDAPLFISYRSGEYGSRLLTSGIRQIIKKYARRLGLPKNVACHTFRHSHFRHLREQGFSMLDMKELGGWKRWDTVERYCTLADSKKITEKMLELNGIKKFTEIKKEEKLRPKPCLLCSTLNDSTNRLCSKCGFVLDQKELQEVEKEKIGTLQRLMRDLPKLEKLLDMVEKNQVCLNDERITRVPLYIYT